MPLLPENISLLSSTSKNRLQGSYCTNVGNRDSPNNAFAAAGLAAKNLLIQILKGVSFPKTPASAVPYIEAKS